MRAAADHHDSGSDSDPSECEYEVEKIVDKRIVHRRVQYKVKWENYPESECTWEPASHLENVMDLIEEYEATHAPLLEDPVLGKPKPKAITAPEQERLNAKLQARLKLSSDSAPPAPVPASVPDSEPPMAPKAAEDKPRRKRRSPFDLARLETATRRASQKKVPVSGERPAESLQICSEKGSFEKDIPKQIVGVRLEEEVPMFRLGWNERIDGTVPASTEHSGEELRLKCPQLLLDFYESKIKFSNKSK